MKRLTAVLLLSCVVLCLMVPLAFAEEAVAEAQGGGAAQGKMFLKSDFSKGRGWMSDPGAPGPYAVGHVNYMLADSEVYDRTVAVGVWYPVDAETITPATPPAEYPLDPWSDYLPVSTSTDWEVLGYDRAYEGPAASDDGPFPLLIVSPGAGVDNWLYNFVGTRLASHGFVVAATDHYGDGQWPWLPWDGLAVIMLNRARDVSFVITELLQKSQTSGELLYGTMNPSRIAMSGHSIGGYAAYALAGGDDEICDALWVANYGGEPLPEFTCVPTLPDPRIRAIIALDGSSQLLRYDELARISVPSLIMGETIENTASMGAMGAATYTWMARPHAAIDRDDSYRVDVIGSNHYSFTSYCDGLTVMYNLGVITAKDLSALLRSWPCTDKGKFAPAKIAAAEAHQIMDTYMIAFLNTYLRDEADAWILTSDYARENQPQVEFFDSERCCKPPSHYYYSYRPHPDECAVAEKDPLDYFAP